MVSRGPVTPVGVAEPELGSRTQQQAGLCKVYNYTQKKKKKKCNDAAASQKQGLPGNPPAFSYVR